MEYRFSTREKNGSICLILSYKVNRKWRQKSRQGFKTKKEARSAQDDLLDAARKDAESGASPELADISLGDFAFNVMMRDKKHSLEYGTAQFYKRAIRRFSSILDKPVRDITEAEIVNAYNALDGQMVVTTMNSYLTVLQSVFNYAMHPYSLRKDNPAMGVIRKRDKRERKIKAFTKSEADGLVKSIQNPSIRLCVLIALNTGMRFSEIGGLTWKDIDFFNRTITVNKQWGKRQDGTTGFKVPKSKNSYRTLHLTAGLSAELLKWKDSRPISIDGRILPTITNCHHEVNKAISSFKPGMHIHSLRHTFATLLLSETQDINLVAAVLGDTPATVSRVYVHYTQDIRKKANDYIDAIFGS